MVTLTLDLPAQECLETCQASLFFNRKHSLDRADRKQDYYFGAWILKKSRKIGSEKVNPPMLHTEVCLQVLGITAAYVKKVE